MSKKSVKVNLMLNMLYTLLMIVTPLLTTPYISRVLGATNIGKYSYYYSIAYYFGLFILTGLNNYGNRTIAIVRNEKNKLSQCFHEIYCMQFIFGIITIIFYNVVSLFSSDLRMSILQNIYLLSMIIDINWFYFGLEEFKITVTRNTVIKIVNIILIFILIRTGKDVYLYAFVMLIGTLVSNSILWFFLPKYINKRKISIYSIKKHIKPNLILFIPVLALSIHTVFDKIMIGSLSNMIEVGYYDNSTKLTQLPSILISSFCVVLLPRISSLVGDGDLVKANGYFKKSLIFSMFLSSGIAFGLSSLINEFVPLFYGDGYDKCKIIIPILLLTAIIVSWSNVIRTQYLIPNHLDKVYVKSTIIGAIVNLILNSFLILQYHAVGAAIATLCAEIVIWIYQYKKININTELKKDIFRSFPFIFFAALMYYINIKFIILDTVIITMICKIIIGGIIYVSLSLLYYVFIIKRDNTTSMF